MPCEPPPPRAGADAGDGAHLPPPRPGPPQWQLGGCWQATRTNKRGGGEAGTAKHCTPRPRTGLSRVEINRQRRKYGAGQGVMWGEEDGDGKFDRSHCQRMTFAWLGIGAGCSAPAGPRGGVLAKFSQDLPVPLLETRPVKLSSGKWLRASRRSAPAESNFLEAEPRPSNGRGSQTSIFDDASGLPSRPSLKQTTAHCWSAAERASHGWRLGMPPRPCGGGREYVARKV